MVPFAPDVTVPPRVTPFSNTRTPEGRVTVPLVVTLLPVKHVMLLAVFNTVVDFSVIVELVLAAVQSVLGVGPVRLGKGFVTGAAPVTGAGLLSPVCPLAPPTTETYPALRDPPPPVN